MADVDFDDFEGGYAPGAALRPGWLPGLVNIAAAACSVGLVVGMAVWGYQLAMRDVNGIPVMRALADPMRTAPVDPGGNEALHQGLSVNAVAAFGTAAPLPDQVILAPNAVELIDEDVAGLIDAPALGSATLSPDPVATDPVATVTNQATDLAAEPVAEAPLDSTTSGGLADPAPLIDPAAIAAAIAAALAAEPAAELGEPALEPVADTDTGPGNGNGLAASPRPSPRPSGRPAALAGSGGSVSDVQSVAGSVAGSGAAPAEIDPASLAVGTRLVQLGAFDDTAAAGVEWTRLQSGFAELMAAKSMVIQPAQSGGRTFYRLRAHGFADEDDARRFCAALLAEGAACIPVAHR